MAPGLLSKGEYIDLLDASESSWRRRNRLLLKEIPLDLIRLRDLKYFFFSAGAK
jgi:hypothetical protein